jgi:hypothetical protein
MMKCRTGHTAVTIAAGLALWTVAAAHAWSSDQGTRSVNTYPAGAEELKATPEAMRAIAIDAPR